MYFMNLFFYYCQRISVTFLILVKKLNYVKNGTYILAVGFFLVVFLSSLSSAYAAERITPVYLRDPLRHTQEPDSYDGSFSYIYPLRTPPGRNGVQPDLSLRYNSGSGKQGDIFGYGWSVNIPYIQRLNKYGTESLYFATSSAVFTSSEDGELASTTATSTIGSIYGPKTENGSFRKYEYATSTGWQVTDKSGTVYTFGTTTASRQTDPDNSAKVHKWLLDEIRDTSGNSMVYEYYKDQGQIYPYKIKYTQNGTSSPIFEVEFFRENAIASLKSYALGFAVTTAYRISEIQAKINDSWVAKYALAYIAGDSTNRSLLSSITETGKGEQGNSISLPPTRFGYQTLSTSQKTWSQYGSSYAPGPFTIGGTNDYGVRFGETNGDGLIDVLRNENQVFIVEAVYENSGNNTWIENFGMDYPSGEEIIFGGGAIDYGVRVFDANGDGLTDLVRSKLGTSTRVYINNGNGTGWTASSSWVVPAYFVSSNGLTDYGVNFGDVNGDGLIDMVQALSGSTTAVYINNANGTGWTVKSSYSVPQYFSDGTKDLGLRIEDINGDGLADLIRARAASRNIYINKGDGTGWTEDSNWSIVQDFINSTDEDTGTRLADINGDGLMDLIRMHLNGGTTTAVYINRGNTWSTDSSWSIPAPFAVNNGLDAGTRLGDINGDGLTDLMRNDNVHTQSFYNQAEVVDLLTSVTEYSGGIVTAVYKGTGEYVDTGSSAGIYNRDVPFIIQTVNAIAKNDRFGAIATTTYDYYGADFYYKNQTEHKFSGFKTIVRTDPLSFVTKTFYHQGNLSSTTKGEYEDHISKAGKPYRVEIYDDSSNLMAKTINRWEYSELGNDRQFSKLANAVEFSYDGDSDHKERAGSYSYDANGNTIGKVEWGEVSGSDDGTFSDTGTDLASTSISYSASSTGYLVGLPSHETTTDYNSNKVRETRYYYDGNTATGTVSKGNLTKEEHWVSGSTYIDTEKTYNNYGLVTQEKDPRDKATTYQYDSYFLYPATSTNSKSHQTQFYYDYSLGKPATTTDANGRDFATVYDALDRVKEIKEPDPHTPSTLNKKTEYAYTDTGSRNIKETNYFTSGTTTEIYKYLDGFDRVTQERKQAEDSNTYAVRDFVYDKRGLLQKESIPYFSTGTGTSSATTTSSALIQYTYDLLDRPTEITNVFGTTNYYYDDWRATTSDPLGYAKSVEKDAFGNIVIVNENATSSPVGGPDDSSFDPYSRITNASNPVLADRADFLSWNILSSIELKSGAIKTDFRSKWVRYLDENGVWSLINTGFATTSEGFVMQNAPFKVTASLTSSGTSTMENNNRWNIFEKRGIAESSLFMRIKAEGVNDVPGRIIHGDLQTPAGLQKNVSYILYEGAYPEGDLIYYVDFGRAPRLEKLVRINSYPTKTRYAFNISYSDGVDFSQTIEGIKREWNKTGAFVFDNTKGISVKRTSRERGIGLKKFQIWDSGENRIKQPVAVEITSRGDNEYILTKDVASFFLGSPVYPVYTDTTSTFYPDPNVESTSVDGTAARSNPTQEVWANLRDGNGNTSQDSTAFDTAFVLEAGNQESKWDYMQRAFYLFDTSSIPDDDSISNATFSVKYDDTGGGTLCAFNQIADLVLSAPSSNTAIANADYEGTVNNITAQSDTQLACSTFDDNTESYKDWTLNATGLGNISKTSVTKLGIRWSGDRSNTEPTWSSAAIARVYARFADETGTSKDPKLVVVHSFVPVESSSTSTYRTLYEYNRLGNLTKITDALGNVRNFTYDGLGKRLTAEDLHASADGTFGSWTFTYDNAGNLTSQADPKSQTVNFTYDDINRVLTEDYTGQAGTEITYTYDWCLEGTGRLCSATSTNAATNYTYWPNGLTKSETKTIDGVDYKTEFAYDRQGNMTTLTYPDKAQTTYTYNSAGLIEFIQHKESGRATNTPVEDIDYGPHGKATVQDFANGTVSTSTYNVNGLWRLNSKHTQFATSTITGGFAYAYDPYEFFASKESPAFTNSLAKMSDPEHGRGFLFAYLDDGPSFQQTRYDVPPGSFLNEAVKLAQLPGTPTQPFNPLPAIEKLKQQSNILWNQEIAEKRDFGALHYRNSDNSITAIFGAGLNFKDNNGNFVRTRSGLVDKGTHFATEQTKFTLELPQTFMGTKGLSGGSESFAWSNFGGNSLSSGELENVDTTIDGYPVKRIIFKEAYNGVDVTYEGYFAGVHENYIIKSPTSTHSFIIDLPAGTTQKTKDGKPEFVKGRFGVKNFNVIPRGKKDFAPDIAFNSFRLTLTVPVQATENYPIILDPSLFDSDADDAGFHDSQIRYDPSGLGGCPAGGAPWATYHDNTGTADVTAESEQSTWTSYTTLNMYGTVNCHERFSRWAFNIDTDSIGVDASISSSTVKWNQTANGTDCDLVEDVIDGPANDAYSFILVDFNPDSASSISTADYDAFGVNIAGEDAKQLGPESNFTSVNGGKSVVFYSTTTYSSYINVTGSSTLGIITRGDQSAVNPNGACVNASSNQTVAGGINATENIRPILLVAYSPPGGGTTTVSGGLQALNYTYDAVGNITKIEDYSSTTAKIVNFGYDALYRLATASTSQASTSPNYLQTWGYNAVGNISSSSALGDYQYDGHTGSNYANPHAVTSIGSMSLSYDRNGNLGTTTQGLTQWLYSWDYKNQITQAASGTATSTFAYDHAGSRVRLATNGAGTTTYPTKNYNVQGATTTKHIYAGNELIAEVIGNGISTSTYIIHTDHLGGVHVVTNASGTAVSTSDYYPYGDLRVNVGLLNEQRRFTGHEYDGGPNLTYAGARYFTGALGNFLSEDPSFLVIDARSQDLLDPQSLNSYAYARNNPIKNFDPDGESWKTFGQGVISPLTYAYNHPFQTAGVVAVSIVAAFVSPVAIAVGGVALGGYAIGSAAYNAYAAPNADMRDYYLGQGLSATSLTAFGIKQAGTTFGPPTNTNGFSLGLYPGSKNVSYPKEMLLQGVTNKTYANTVNNLYRPNSRVGPSGNTVDALRYEIATGNKLSPIGHLTKIQDTLNSFTNVLSSGNFGIAELRSMQAVLNDISNALSNLK